MCVCACVCVCVCVCACVRVHSADRGGRLSASHPYVMKLAGPVRSHCDMTNVVRFVDFLKSI